MDEYHRSYKNTNIHVHDKCNLGIESIIFREIRNVFSRLDRSKSQMKLTIHEIDQYMSII